MPRQEIPHDIRDLVDFYNRWPDLRNDVRNLDVGSGLTRDQLSIIQWMILTIDRIGPADLSADTDRPS